MTDWEPPIVTAVELDEPRRRPNRPALIELAAALLIVAGVLGVVSLIAPDPNRPKASKGWHC